MGSILNTTGKRISFSKGIEKHYCTDFLDFSKVCKHGSNSNFVHVIYPSGFTKNDRTLMAKHIQEMDGLSVVKERNVS